MSKLKNKSVLIEAIGLVLTLIWFYCLLIPIMFDFQKANNIGKFFMALGSLLFLAGYVFLFVEFIRSKGKEKLKSRESISGWAFLVAILIIYILFVTRYFTNKLEGIVYFAVGLAIVFGCFLGTFDFVKLVEGWFGKEKVAVFIFSFALGCLLLSVLVVDTGNAETGVLIRKLSVGVLWIVALTTLARNSFFTYKNNHEDVKIWRLALDILLGAGLLVGFPFYIKWWGLSDENLNIFVTAYSAVVGGSLTLAGVAWTIRKTNNDRQEDEKKKFKPLLIFFNGSNESDYEIKLEEVDKKTFVVKKTSESRKYPYILESFKLYNINFNDCFIVGLIFNGTEHYWRKSNLYVEKNKIVLFSLQDSVLCLEQPINTIGVLVKDLLGNFYVLDLSFNTENDNKGKSFVYINGSKGMDKFLEE